eukprot:scaffold1987_cov377-Prasinococcus_capsulatus_cf.AAC.11
MPRLECNKKSKRGGPAAPLELSKGGATQGLARQKQLVVQVVRGRVAEGLQGVKRQLLLAPQAVPQPDQEHAAHLRPNQPTHPAASAPQATRQRGP